MDKKAVLFSEMTPDQAWEAEFNAWYDEEHIPIRMKAPGFTGAQRYRRVDGPDYLAIYDMTTPGALATPEYQTIKGLPSERTSRMLRDVQGFTRYIGEEIDCVARPDAVAGELAPYVYAVFFNVPEARAPEFEDWYAQDHIPTLLKCKDWLMVRRFRIRDGSPEQWSHLALHYLASTSALDSPERAQARASAWRDRLAAESWFKGKYAVFARHGDRFAGSQ